MAKNDINTYTPPAEKLARLGIAPQEWDFVFRLQREKPDAAASRVLTRAQWGLLLLVVLIGRFRYVVLDAILVVAAVAWGVWWLSRRAKLMREPAGASTTGNSQ